MAGKRGRPRKDATKINVELSEDERGGLKDIMIEALRGGRIGDIEPLTPTAFANPRYDDVFYEGINMLDEMKSELDVALTLSIMDTPEWDEAIDYLKCHQHTPAK